MTQSAATIMATATKSTDKDKVKDKVAHKRNKSTRKIKRGKGGRHRQGR